MATVTRLSPYLRERIIKLYQNGVNQTEIVKIMLKEDNVKISRKTVNKWVNYFRKYGSICKPKKMLKQKKLNDDHIDYIEICLKRKS